MQVVFMVVALAFSFVVYQVLFHILSNIIGEKISRIVLLVSLLSAMGYVVGLLFTGDGTTLAITGAVISFFWGYYSYVVIR